MGFELPVCFSKECAAKEGIALGGWLGLGLGLGSGLGLGLGLELELGSGLG